MTTQRTSNTVFPNVYPQNLTQFVYGNRCSLWDSAGKRYLDFASGIAVNALGYGNRKLAKIASLQYVNVAHVSNLYTTKSTVDLAESMLAYQPIVGRKYQTVFFANSGAEANEAALKFATIYSLETYRRAPLFATFKNAFHGRTFLTLAVTPHKKYQSMYKKILPPTVVLPYNNRDALHKLLNKNISAIIIEVIQGEGGMQTLSTETAAVLNNICKMHNIVLIADEIQTGLGRTGTVYASEQIGLRPDIITVAKPLGGGLPLSATLLTKKINDTLTVGMHGSTFGGGPVQCAIAKEVWQTVTSESFLKQVREVSAYLEKQLQYMALKYSFIKEIRGFGLLRGVSLKKTIDVQKIIKSAFDNGLLLLRSGENTLRLAPPLIITKKDVDVACAILKHIFEDIPKK